MKKTRKSQEAKLKKVRKIQAELADAVRDLIPDASFAEQEQTILDLTDQIRKEITQDTLQCIADDLGDRVAIDGKYYTRHQSGTVQYYSLAGALLISRSTYREVGVRNGPTVVPLELAAGLVERATPAMGRNIAHGYAVHDLRTHGELLKEAHCTPPPRATMERIAKNIAQVAHENVADLEELAFRGEIVPEAACGISLGFDRTSVSMTEVLPSGELKDPPKRKKPYQRAMPPPMKVNWRMAYVGTVCLVDENGDALKTYRYATTAADDPEELAGRMRLQVRRSLKQMSSPSVGIVQDGAPEMWNVMRGVLTPIVEEGIIEQWSEAIDLPHLMQRLGEAHNLIYGKNPKRVEEWKSNLMRSDSAIDNIESLLKKGLGKLSNEEAKIVEGHLTYIANNKDRMRYPSLLRQGLPVGSGVTESTAKNVVNMRAKRSGQRWSIPGLRGVLTLRALLKSDGFGRFWEALSTTYAANVNNLAAAA